MLVVVEYRLPVAEALVELRGVEGQYVAFLILRLFSDPTDGCFGALGTAFLKVVVPVV